MSTRAIGTVVMVTDWTLFPIRGGSQVRIVALVGALRHAGFRVVLVARRTPWRHFPLLPGPRTTWKTWRLADALVSVDGPTFQSGSPMSFDVAPYRRSLRTAIERYRPSAVIAEYLWLAPCLDVVPEGTLRVIDTHDVMHVRDAMYRDQSHGAWVVCTEDEEAALLTHGDVILAIQEHERATFARMLPSKRIVYIPHVVTTPAAAIRTGRRPVVGFVGSAIQGNVVGLRAFLDHAWPVVRARCPAAQLHVYGDVVRGLERDVPGLLSIGFVSDASEVYRQATVMINPVTLGTGLKIKTVEALGHGSALVTTSCGAAGLEDGAPHAFLLENDMPSFGDAVATLLADPVRREELGRAGRALAIERFGQDAVARRLRMLLDPEGSARAPDSIDARAASRGSWSSGGEATS